MSELNLFTVSPTVITAGSWTVSSDLLDHVFETLTKRSPQLIEEWEPRVRDGAQYFVPVLLDTVESEHVWKLDSKGERTYLAFNPSCFEGYTGEHPGYFLTVDQLGLVVSAYALDSLFSYGKTGPYFLHASEDPNREAIEQTLRKSEPDDNGDGLIIFMF